MYRDLRFFNVGKIIKKLKNKTYAFVKVSECCTVVDTELNNSGVQALIVHNQSTLMVYNLGNRSLTKGLFT